MRTRDVGEHDLAGLGLARAGFARDYDGLVLLFGDQLLVTVLRHHKQVRPRVLGSFVR